MAALAPYYFHPNTLQTPCEGFSPSHRFRVRQNDVTDTWPGCPDSFKMAASKVASFETNVVRIAGISEAETSVSGKAECLLVMGEDKKVSVLD